jgi:predicted acyltransferase
MEKIAERLVSLDVFRGITIAGMILVNNPGDWGNVYPALLHAKWNGCTPTDLIFPFFLFIVGVSITLSLTKRKEHGDKRSKLFFQIVKRGILIFAIGLVLNGFPYFDLSTLRIPGVLQRIAVVYIITAFLFLKSNWKIQSIISVVLLFLYWGMVALTPVPGFGKPDLSAPLIFDPITNQYMPSNIAGWLDNFLLSGHMWSETKFGTLKAFSALCRRFQHVYSECCWGSI